MLLIRLEPNLGRNPHPIPHPNPSPHLLRIKVEQLTEAILHLLTSPYISLYLPISPQVEQLTEANGKATRTTSKINLVDLAGSERASKTGASGETLKEAISINQARDRARLYLR